MMKLKLGDDDDAPTLGGFNRALRIERNRTVRRGGVLYARPRATAAPGRADDGEERPIPAARRTKSWQNWVEP